MIFHADIAVALALIAIGVGFWVLSKSQSMENTGLKTTGKFLGYLITVAAVLTLLCTTYYSLKYWEDGAFKSASAVQMCTNHGGMMGGMMSGHQGMMGMMGGGCDKMMMGDRGKCEPMGSRAMSSCSRMMGKGDKSGHMKGMMPGGEKSMMKMKGNMMEDGPEDEDDES